MRIDNDDFDDGDDICADCGMDIVDCVCDEDDLVEDDDWGDEENPWGDDWDEHI